MGVLNAGLLLFHLLHLTHEVSLALQLLALPRHLFALPRHLVGLFCCYPDLG